MNDKPAETEKSSFVKGSDNDASSDGALEYSSDNSPRTPHYSTVFTSTESEGELNTIHILKAMLKPIYHQHKITSHLM